MLGHQEEGEGYSKKKKGGRDSSDSADYPNSSLSKTKEKKIY